jgi:hypothetical protein
LVQRVEVVVSASLASLPSGSIQFSVFLGCLAFLGTPLRRMESIEHVPVIWI